MKARLVDVASWECSALVEETPHDFYHLPAYVLLSAAHERGTARALLVEDGPRKLYLPIIVRPIPNSMRADATSPYGYPGPLVGGTDDPSFTREALTAGVEALRDAGLVSLFVRFHPLLNPVVPDGVGAVVGHGATISIDLHLRDSVIWDQMRRNHRRDILRATQRGLVARVDRSFDRYAEFRRLYRATMDRREATAYYYFDDEYFDQLRGALGDRLHLAVVEDGSTVAAAGLFVVTNGLVEYHLMGSDEAYGRGEPAKLMVHFIATWSRQRGSHSFHLGGGVGGADDSLLHFKAGFSPRRHPYHTLRVVLDEEEYGNLAAARDPTLDPGDLTGYFPAYRTD